MKIAMSSAIALSLALSAPNPVYADLKDALIGGVIGAAINQSVRNSQAQKRATAKRTTRTVKNRANVPASLNSQFTRDERRQIQTSLNNMGLNVGVVDGSLGPKSRAAISQFQASRGEAATGQMTRAQFLALTGVGFAAPAPAFADRQLNLNEVVMLQQSLQRLGFYRGTIDGINGAGTQNARAAFLASQGQNPMQVPQVQSLAMASTAAGYTLPQNLMQEAQAQFAAASGATGFGAAPVPQSNFGQLPQQNNQFGTPTTSAGFATPPPPQPVFGAQPATQGTAGFAPQTAPQQQPLFGAPTQQQMPQQQQQPLFGAPAQAAPQPQQVQPIQQPQNNAIFASTGGATAPQQQIVVAPQQAPSALDIFAPQSTGQPAAVAQQPTQPAVLQPVAPQPQQQGAAAPVMTFTAPATDASLLSN
ncbi:peptidoglycan-binding domain-containing protein [Sulfitobacter sp. HNIBRBA3233]|uniref:peptidoglycan-binding domain-containing protein n=1 Tax=Sulfitobacter marinivivus TaxID=3158558 RepID=UPI0032DFA7C4